MKRDVHYILWFILSVMICVQATLSHCNAQSHPPEHKKAPIQTKKLTVAQQKARAESERMINVATLHINDGAALKVHRAFRAAKIPVMVMGSRMYGVLVQKKDHDRAIRLLKADSKRQGYWVRLNP